MSPFTEKEIGYLRGQRLGRMATGDANSSPHIAQSASGLALTRRPSTSTAERQGR